MDFQQQLIQAKFLKRYKRFFADVELKGKVVVAHVPNTGSMKGCNDPESECLISKATDPNRKLQYTLEAVKTDHHWVGVNTSWPNKLAVELIETHKIPHWQKYNSYQTEVKINEHSRIDLVLWNSKDTDIKKWKASDFIKEQPVHFVEIKNVTLKNDKVALFPDAVTERGQKHIEELVELIEKGCAAEILFIVQRTDVVKFEPARDIDPVYAELLKKAVKKGLLITAVSFDVTEKGIYFNKILPVNL